MKLLSSQSLKDWVVWVSEDDVVQIDFAWLTVISDDYQSGTGQNIIMWEWPFNKWQLKWKNVNF